MSIAAALDCRLRGRLANRADGRHHVSAVHQLHGEEAVFRLDGEFVQAYQVGMSDVRERAEFTFEAIDVPGAGAAERLQRHDLIPDAVVDFVHHTHAACADASPDRIPLGTAEVGPDFQFLERHHT